MEIIDFLNPEIPNLISVIIPTYNCAKHLQPMLDSIYRQTYPNFEIIFAYDEKSTDNTLDILQKNAQTHNLIIDTGNDASLGASRNRGARLASGTYILFLDADDLIIPTYFERMIEVFNQHPELNVVHSGFLTTDEKHAKKMYSKAKSKKSNSRLCSTISLLPVFFLQGFGMPWTWLVKRSFIIENHIVGWDCTWGEDTIYSFQLLMNTSCIGEIEEPGYIWIQHTSSLTHTNDNNLVKRREDRLKIANEMFERISIRYPALYPIFKRNYELFCNRDFVYSIRKYDYCTFRLLLHDHNIEKIESVKSDSYKKKAGIICFNHAKRIFWLINKIL